MNERKLKEIIGLLSDVCNVNQIHNRKNLEVVYKKYVDFDGLDVVFENEEFVIEFDERVNKFLFRTNFSNLEIDIDFVINLNILNNLVNRMNYLVK